MEAIRPLLQLPQCEVLVNFMTSQIRRFVRSNDPELRPSFNALYGDETYLSRIYELELEYGADDAPVVAYCEALQRNGGFKYVSRAIVFNPKKDDTHYHLIYATRHEKGLEEFKEAERKGMEKQEERRSNLLTQGVDQMNLFDIEAVSPLQTYYKKLREDYSNRNQVKIMRLLREAGDVSYDDLWAAALLEPMTWRSDLNGFLQGLKNEGKIQFAGLAPRGRVLKRGEGHRVKLV